MINLVYSNQSLMLKKHVEKLVNEHLEVLNDFSCVNFDCEVTPLRNIIVDAETLAFGCDKKVVIAKNAYFFTENTPKKDINNEIDYAELKRYFDVKDDNCLLIFTAVTNKIAEKKDWSKLLKQKGKIIEIPDINEKDRPLMLRKLLEKKNVVLANNEVFLCLLERIGSDLNSIVNDIDKLQLLGTTVTKEAVIALISRPLEDNVFGIIDALINKDINAALKIFYDLRIQNEDPISLLPRMASQLRLIYQVFYLKNQNYHDDEIAKELAVHPYRVTLALRKQKQLSAHRILKMIRDLAILDLEIKSGIADKYQSFEMFLVRYA